MNIKDIGYAPSSHEPMQLCPLCDQPLYIGGLAVWYIGDGMVEILHETCAEEARQGGEFDAAPE